MGSRSVRRGQSTLEYILVLAAVLIAVIAAAQGFATHVVEKNVKESKNVVDKATVKAVSGLGL